MRIRSHGCEGHRRPLRTRGGPGVCCQRRAASRAGGRGRHPAGLGRLLSCQGRTRVLAPNPPNHATNKTQRRAEPPRPGRVSGFLHPPRKCAAGGALRRSSEPRARSRPPAAASRSEHREAGAAGVRQLPTPRNPGGRGPGRASPVTDTGAHLGPSALSLLSRRTAARLPRRASVSPRSGGRVLARLLSGVGGRFLVQAGAPHRGFTWQKGRGSSGGVPHRRTQISSRGSALKTEWSQTRHCGLAVRASTRSRWVREGPAPVGLRRA